MTKVEITFHLNKPLDDELMQQIAGLHSVYGIHRVRLSPEQDAITVDYDASRLTGRHVLAVLRRAGFPVTDALPSDL